MHRYLTKTSADNIHSRDGFAQTVVLLILFLLRLDFQSVQSNVIQQSGTRMSARSIPDTQIPTLFWVHPGLQQINTSGARKQQIRRLINPL